MDLYDNILGHANTNYSHKFYITMNYIAIILYLWERNIN